MLTYSITNTYDCCVVRLQSKPIKYYTWNSYGPCSWMGFALHLLALSLRFFSFYTVLETIRYKEISLIQFNFNSQALLITNQNTSSCTFVAVVHGAKG